MFLMSLKKKRKQLIAAALAAVTTFSAAVPAVAVSAPAVLAQEADPADLEGNIIEENPDEPSSSPGEGDSENPSSPEEEPDADSSSKEDEPQGDTGDPAPDGSGGTLEEVLPPAMPNGVGSPSSIQNTPGISLMQNNAGISPMSIDDTTIDGQPFATVQASGLVFTDTVTPVEIVLGTGVDSVKEVGGNILRIEEQGQGTGTFQLTNTSIDPRVTALAFLDEEGNEIGYVHVQIEPPNLPSINAISLINVRDPITGTNTQYTQAEAQRGIVLEYNSSEQSARYPYIQITLTNGMTIVDEDPDSWFSITGSGSAYTQINLDYTKVGGSKTAYIRIEGSEDTVRIPITIRDTFVPVSNITFNPGKTGEESTDYDSVEAIQQVEEQGLILGCLTSMSGDVLQITADQNVQVKLTAASEDLLDMQRSSTPYVYTFTLKDGVTEGLAEIEIILNRTSNVLATLPVTIRQDITPMTETYIRVPSENVQTEDTTGMVLNDYMTAQSESSYGQSTVTLRYSRDTEVIDLIHDSLGFEPDLQETDEWILPLAEGLTCDDIQITEDGTSLLTITENGDSYTITPNGKGIGQATLRVIRTDNNNNDDVITFKVNVDSIIAYPNEAPKDGTLEAADDSVVTLFKMGFDGTPIEDCFQLAEDDGKNRLRYVLMEWTTENDRLDNSQKVYKSDVILLEGTWNETLTGDNALLTPVTQGVPQGYTAFSIAQTTGSTSGTTPTGRSGETTVTNGRDTIVIQTAARKGGNNNYRGYIAQATRYKLYKYITPKGENETDEEYEARLPDQRVELGDSVVLFAEPNPSEMEDGGADTAMMADGEETDVLEITVGDENVTLREEGGSILDIRRPDSSDPYHWEVRPANINAQGTTKLQILKHGVVMREIEVTVQPHIQMILDAGYLDTDGWEYNRTTLIPDGIFEILYELEETKTDTSGVVHEYTPYASDILTFTLGANASTATDLTGVNITDGKDSVAAPPANLITVDKNGAEVTLSIPENTNREEGSVGLFLEKDGKYKEVTIQTGPVSRPLLRYARVTYMEKEPEDVLQLFQDYDTLKFEFDSQAFPEHGETAEAMDSDNLEIQVRAKDVDFTVDSAEFNGAEAYEQFLTIQRWDGAEGTERFHISMEEAYPGSDDMVVMRLSKTVGEGEDAKEKYKLLSFDIKEVVHRLVTDGILTSIDGVNTSVREEFTYSGDYEEGTGSAEGATLQYQTGPYRSDQLQLTVSHTKPTVVYDTEQKLVCQQTIQGNQWFVRVKETASQGSTKLVVKTADRTEIFPITVEQLPSSLEGTVAVTTCEITDLAGNVMELDVDTINAEGPVVLQMDGNTKEQLTLVPESGATVTISGSAVERRGNAIVPVEKGAATITLSKTNRKDRVITVEVENLEPVTVQKQLASGSWIAQENAKTEGITLLSNPTGRSESARFTTNGTIGVQSGSDLLTVDPNTKTITPTGKSGTATIVIRPQNASTHDAVEIPVTIVAVQNSQDKDFTPGREFEELGGKVGIEEATVAIGFPEPGDEDTPENEFGATYESGSGVRVDTSILEQWLTQGARDPGGTSRTVTTPETMTLNVQLNLTSDEIKEKVGAILVNQSLFQKMQASDCRTKQIDIVIREQNGVEIYRWTVEDSDVETMTDGQQEVNLAVRAEKDSYTTDRLSLSFAHSGDLPGKNGITFTTSFSGNTARNYYSLYAVNPDGTLGERQTDVPVTVTSAGKVSVKIKHCSEWMIAPTNQNSGNTGGGSGGSGGGGGGGGGGGATNPDSPVTDENGFHIDASTGYPFQSASLPLDTKIVNMIDGVSVYDFLVKGNNDTGNIQIEASDPSVATVELYDADDSRGAKYRVTALKTGEIELKVTYNGEESYMRVNVYPLGGSIMLDTTSYTMAPGNIYDIGVTVKDGNNNTLSGAQVQQMVQNGELRVTDSRTGSIVNLVQLPNGNFRVTGRNEGTCYIVYEVIQNDEVVTHASVKMTVQNGAAQGGASTRDTSYWANKE